MSTEPEEKAFFYFLFARLFREAPDDGLLKEIVEKKLLSGLSQIFTPRRGQAEKSCLSPSGEPLEDPERFTQVEDIAVEHTALFILSRESYTPPYESYYCDSLTIDSSTACSPYFQPETFPTGTKGFLGGPSATAVQKIYQEKGFTLSPNFHDLPDHVACELEFMGRLCEKGEIEAAESFFKGHLGRWIFLFLDRVIKQNRSIFYQKVASSLADFLKEEHWVEVRLS